MRKADVVDRIAETTGIPKVDVLVTLETFFKEVKSSLIDGEPVFVRGFGTFGIKTRAAKVGRNIKKGTPVDIPAHNIADFKPARELKEAMKQTIVKAPENSKS